MTEPSVRLGTLLREARERREMRQEDVARAVAIGTSTYRSLESGKASGPSLYTVLDLLGVLGIRAAELDGLNEDRDSPP